MNKEMNQQKKENPCNVKTGLDTRLRYEHVWEPDSYSGWKPKYSVTALIPKTDTETVEKIRGAVQAAYERGESKLRGSGKSVPPLNTLRQPLQDGDKEHPEDPAYAGMWYFNASSDEAPGIVDRHRQTILDRTEVYAGCYCRVSAGFYAYNTGGNRGISCTLYNLQKVRDGERFSGRPSARQDFDDLDDDDEDFLR